MKKFLFGAAAVASLLFASCTKESYYHTMAITYPTQTGVVFADQEIDSVVFYTTDSYQASSNADWLVIPTENAAMQIDNYYRYVWEVVVPVYFEANTTGKPRSAQVLIHTFGGNDWDQQGYATFYQISWLDVYKPQAAYSYYNGIPSGASFEATDSATQVTDTLKFYVYDNWTLTDGSNFVHPVSTSGTKGENVVAVNVEPNPTTGERKDSVLLTCRGVKTYIKFKQEAPKQD